MLPGDMLGSISFKDEAMTEKKDRHSKVEVTCQLESCGKKFLARKERVEKGQSRFCSMKHYREYQKLIGPQRKNIGKENAIILWDKPKKMYVAYWYDDQMKYHSTPWARWWWELNRGNVPDGYYASYVDGNSKNNKPENVCLKTMAEISDIGERSRGVPKSTETRRKLSEAHTGKILSDEHKENIGRAVSEMWKSGAFDSPETRAAYARQGRATKGSKRTGEQKKVLSDIHKRRYANPEERERQRQRQFSYWSRIENKEERIKIIRETWNNHPEYKEKLSKTLKGRVVSEEHRKNLSKALKGVYTGELASGYKDGKSIGDYPRQFGVYIKNYVRRRDGYMCQSCGEDVHGKRNGQVHHIDNIKENCEEDNLILLCIPCHQAVHGKKNITNEMIEYLKTRLTR